MINSINPNVKYDLALWLYWSQKPDHMKTGLNPAAFDRMTLKEIYDKYRDLLVYSPYTVYKDIFGEYLIYKR